MNEEEMLLAGIYCDENGRYHRRPRSKEDQETFDEYERLRDKAEEELNKLFENPTQEGLESFSKFLAEQKRPDYSDVEKLIGEWRKTRGILKEFV